MNLRRIYAIFLRQLFLLRHNWTRFSAIFVWITIDILLWGFITKYLNVISHSGFNFIPMLLGAILLWDFLVRVQQGIILALLEDVWAQNFLNYFASPLTIGEYISGLIVTSIVTTIVGFGFIIIIAGILFGYNIFSLGLNLALFLFVLFIFGLALGILTSGIVLRLGPSAEWIAWPIPAIISPLAGIFYPISTLPHSFQFIAKCLPPAYVFEGMRQVLSLKILSPSYLLTGVGLSLIYLLFAYIFFNYIYRVVIRTGIITRFSAESTS